MDKYILVDDKPVRTENLEEWAHWYETSNLTVIRTVVSKDVKVSTVFLSIDHAL